MAKFDTSLPLPGLGPAHVKEHMPEELNEHVQSQHDPKIFTIYIRAPKLSSHIDTYKYIKFWSAYIDG